MTTENPSDNNDEVYVDIPVNEARTVVTGIESSIESATKKVEELLDNSKDAHATEADLTLAENENKVAVEDNGIAFKNYLHVVTWASDHKEKEEKINDSPDSTGMFGEGAKSMLSIANTMKFEGNNGGAYDEYVKLQRTPKLGEPLRTVKYTHKQYPKGYLKEKLGTRVTCEDVSDDHIGEIKNNIKESSGTKFAWLIAEGFRMRVKIINKQAKIVDIYNIPIANRLKPLFEDYPAKARNIGSLLDKNKEKDVLIQAIAVENVKPSQRRIIYARKKRIIKEVPTRFDVMMIVNFDSTKILKDRTSFDMNDPITKQYLDMVDEYTKQNFSMPTNPYDSLNSRQKNEYHKMLEMLNEIAKEHIKFEEPDKKPFEEKPRKATVPADQQNTNAMLETTRKVDPAKLLPADQVLQTKIRQKREKRGKKGKKRGTPKKLKERSVLVIRTRRLKNKLVHAIGINLETKDEEMETFVDFATMPMEDEPETQVIVQKEKRKIILWFNELGNYFKSKRPKTYPNPRFELKDMIPLIAVGMTQALFGHLNLPYLEYQKKVDGMQHILSGLYLGEGNVSD